LPKKHHAGNNIWLTSSDVAEYCQVSRNTVLSWIKSKKLKAFNLPSGHYRIEKEDFIDFLKDYNIPIKELLFSTEFKMGRR